jgi:hypothetical protein
VKVAVTTYEYRKQVSRIHMNEYVIKWMKSGKIEY